MKDSARSEESQALPCTLPSREVSSATLQLCNSAKQTKKETQTSAFGMGTIQDPSNKIFLVWPTALQYLVEAWHAGSKVGPTVRWMVF